MTLRTTDLEGTPYGSLDGARVQLCLDLESRVKTLRRRGVLTAATLRDYYDTTRFEQIAQSNAIEGSTLTVGETKLVVLKGITITGHDPGYILDAQALGHALELLYVMASGRTATDIQQVKQLHELILQGRMGAGDFRTAEVRIRGARHRPPQTWGHVMTSMESWQEWSRTHRTDPALLRASVLHAWLEHIHPFIDGNGRTGRAIGNLELLRAGYPSIIFRLKDRGAYLKALALADEGDLGPFLDLSSQRMSAALRVLER